MQQRALVLVRQAGQLRVQRARRPRRVARLALARAPPPARTRLYTTSYILLLLHRLSHSQIIYFPDETCKAKATRPVFR